MTCRFNLQKQMTRVRLGIGLRIAQEGRFTLIGLSAVFLVVLGALSAGSAAGGADPSGGAERVNKPAAAAQRNGPIQREKDLPKPTPDAAAMPSPDSSKPSADTGNRSPVWRPHQLSQQLFQVGALTCAARANQVAAFLGNGKETVVLQLPSKNPDSGLLMATLAFPPENGSSKLASLSFAPNRLSGCDGSYQQVSFVDSSCREALAKEFSGLTASPIGHESVLMVPLNKSARVFAMQAGKGCVLLKQEIVE